MSDKPHTLNPDEFVALGGDLCEFGIDQLLDDGVLRSFPIVGFAKGLFKTVSNVREYMFTKKLYEFLNNLHGFDERKRKRFEKIISKDKGKKRIGERLLFLLERMDEVEKAKMLSRAFKAYLDEVIDRELFMRLCTAIDKIQVEDVKVMVRVEGNLDEVDYCVRDSLVGTGMFSFRISGCTDQTEYYEINPVGKAFQMYILS